MDPVDGTPQDTARGRTHPESEELLDAEALYTRGMAHYRRREWQRAMEYFVRLKALEPNRPGIDALLDELDWFIQLQAMGPEAQTLDTASEDVRQIQEPEVKVVSPPRPKGARPPLRINWQWVVWPVLVVAVGVAAFFLFAFPQPDPIEELYNRAQAQMNVGDYEAAIQLFEEILQRDPSHQGAQFGLEKARRLANLGILYQNVQVYISNSQWDLAAAELDKILQIDPSYRDASTLAQTVERRKTVSELYKEALAFFDQEEWAKAIERLERVRAFDATYQDTEVRNKLYTAYLNAGSALLVQPQVRAADIRSAIQHFSSALTLRPQSQEAAALKRDAEAYLGGLTAYENGELDLAIARLLNFYQSTPGYAGGNLAQLLYDAYLRRGDVYRDDGRYIEAANEYRKAQGIAVPDTSEAIAREQEIFTVYITPTPTATPTPTPTPTRRPTATRVPPTATPIPPPPPTPIPPTPIPPPPTRPPR